MSESITGSVLMTLRMVSCDTESVPSEMVSVQLTESPGETESGDKVMVLEDPSAMPVVSLVHT